MEGGSGAPPDLLAMRGPALMPSYGDTGKGNQLFLLLIALGGSCESFYTKHFSGSLWVLAGCPVMSLTLTLITQSWHRPTG